MKDHVTVRIESAAFLPETVHVAELTGCETISRLFEFQLRLVTTDPAGFDEDKLLTSLVDLVFERTHGATGMVTEERRITGIVCTLRDRTSTQTAHREVLVTFVPRAWKATLTRTSDIYMDLTVPEIIRKKLTSGGLPDAEIQTRLEAAYAPREFVVQYKESDYDFVCRLAEDLGIHFFFERTSDLEILVFGDANAAFTPSLPEIAPFVGVGDRSSVFVLEATRQVVSKQFTARDYNYRNPSVDLLGEAQLQSLGGGGVVDEFGPHAKTGDEVTRYAAIRAQEAATRHLTYEGRSELPGLRAGSIVIIEGHPRGELELVVVEVKHASTQAALGQGSGEEIPYANTFRAIPKAVEYRPPRITPKPVVHGVVTGIVESEAGTDFGAVDDEGRYHVSFMYDTVASRGEGRASRPLRMAQPSAGAGRGFHQPLKPGTEVVISCLNGDPDRPIIAGAVPNPQTPSPVTAANSEKSMWTTNVNQIAIDDDKPRMKLTVDGTAHVIQLGAPNGPELGVYISTAKNVSSMAKGVSSSYSKMRAAYTDRKVGTATDDIVEAAGIPNPLSTWDKIESALDATAEFASSVGEMIDGVEEAYVDFTTDAHEDKKVADQALNESRKEIHEILAKQAAANPKIVVNEDGSARYETAEEAKKRGYAAELKDPANKRLADELEAFTKASAEADKALHDLQNDAGEEGAGLVAEGVDAVKKAGKTVQGALAKVAEAKTSVAAIAAVLKKIPGAELLISKVSEVFAKATYQALDATVSATQKLGHAVPKASGQRMGDDVGTFNGPYNIQLSRNSSALYGWKNSFVYGGKNATVFSAGSSTVIGRKRVDVKSTSLVELAAKVVAISSKKEVDVYSDGTVAIVARSKGVKVDKASSVVIHGQKDVHVVSDDESLHLKANKNVSVFAKDGNLVLTAKKGDLLASTQEGNVELEAVKGKGKIATKKDLTVTADDNLTIKTTKAMVLDAKGAAWKVKDNLTVNAGKVTVKSKKDVVLKGSKVKLA